MRESSDATQPWAMWSGKTRELLKCAPRCGSVSDFFGIPGGRYGGDKRHVNLVA